MRKGRDGGKKRGKKKRGKKTGKKKKRQMKIVATTSLPAVDCLNADRWNAARSRQYIKDENIQNNFFEYFKKMKKINKKKYNHWKL